MKTNGNTTLIDNYFGLLSGLSKENKLELITKLSDSITEDIVDMENVVDRFYGAFKSEKTAEEIINEIKIYTDGACDIPSR